MILTKESMLCDIALRYPIARGWLKNWRAAVRAACWTSLVDLKKMYSSVDLVTVQSGQNVIVFNVCGNSFRLIVAVHFNRQIVYTLCFLTHAEYSKNQWRKLL
jgi:mRNA interferase HigB